MLASSNIARCRQNRKIFTNHGSFMDGIELFDHRAFSIAEREAIHMDPSQRHVLEVAYEALLSAGQQKDFVMKSIKLSTKIIVYLKAHLEYVSQLGE
eukprot:992912-Amphidinium_carterae.1